MSSSLQGKTTGVETALKQQVVAAVEPQYLEARRDPTTRKLNGTISEIVKHLFDVYGRVTPQTLFEQEQKVHQMVYDPQHPIDRVFTAVNELANYVEAASTPYTQPQCINLAYRILNRSGAFQRWILEWNQLPQAQRNWRNFKNHFRKARRELKETTNLQARESQYHANALRELVQELKQDLHQKPPPSTDQESIPPVISISDDSNDSSISALQSKVVSLKDYIHNIHSPYTMPVQQPPFFQPQHP